MYTQQIVCVLQHFWSCFMCPFLRTKVHNLATVECIRNTFAISFVDKNQSIDSGISVLICYLLKCINKSLTGLTWNCGVYNYKSMRSKQLAGLLHFHSFDFRYFSQVLPRPTLAIRDLQHDTFSQSVTQTWDVFLTIQHTDHVRN